MDSLQARTIQRRTFVFGVSVISIFPSNSAAFAQSPFNNQTKRIVVARAAKLIAQRYVYPDRGLMFAHALRQERFAEATPEAFAAALTQFLRRISNDGHFAVEYNPNPSSAADAQASQTQAALNEAGYYGHSVNHGFETVGRLEGGVGYLDLRVFAPTAIAKDMAISAMTILAQSPALIIDLRRNGGGHSDMVALLASYLFDRPVELSGTFDRPSGVFTRSFTEASVLGRRFGGEKPVFILTSKRTFSAAEAFAYDLQALKRAKIIGEPSGGGAHPFENRIITPSFTLSLPEGRSINPITKGDWEGTGVQPDVRATMETALNVALPLALEAINSTLGRD